MFRVQYQRLKYYLEISRHFTAQDVWDSTDYIWQLTDLPLIGEGDISEDDWYDCNTTENLLEISLFF